MVILTEGSRARNYRTKVSSGRPVVVFCDRDDASSGQKWADNWLLAQGCPTQYVKLGGITESSNASGTKRRHQSH